MCQLENVLKGEERIVVLRDISFKEYAGCVAVLGLNKAGKTMLFQTNLGLIAPDKWAIIVDDTDPFRGPVK